MQNVHDGSKQTLIMIVDDDAALGEMLSIVLNSSGFETVTCQDGLRAVEMFPTLHPDLVLLDIMLPGLDGVQVAHRIRHTAYGRPPIHRLSCSPPNPIPLMW